MHLQHSLDLEWSHPRIFGLKVHFPLKSILAVLDMIGHIGLLKLLIAVVTAHFNRLDLDAKPSLAKSHFTRFLGFNVRLHVRLFDWLNVRSDEFDLLPERLLK